MCVCVGGGGGATLKGRICSINKGSPIFGFLFLKNQSFKIAMGGRDWASSEVYLLVNFFSKFNVTFILQWIAFIFGREEEEDQ